MRAKTKMTKPSDKALNRFGLMVIAGSIVFIVTTLVFTQCKSETPSSQGIFETTPAWIFESSDRLAADLVATDRAVYVRTQSGVTVLSLADGSVQQTIETRGHIGIPSPWIYGSFLIIPENGGTLAVFSTSSGELLWRHSPKYNADIQAMTASNGVLVLSRHSEYITAYDLATGDIRWRVDIPDRSYVHVVAENGIVYTDLEGRLIAYNIASGDQIWTMFLDILIGRTLLEDNMIYAVLGSEESTTIVAVDKNAQSVKWKRPFYTSAYTIGTYLTSDDGVIYAASDTLMAIAGDSGRILWLTDFIGNLFQPMVLGDTVVVVGGRRLYAFDKRTGQQMGMLSIQTGILPTIFDPVVAGDLLIVPVNNSTIHAFHLN